MPGKHNKPTIAFRPSSSWQYSLINERAKLSGMAKKDFICRSLIYANICVVGKKENIRIIVDAVQELQYAMQEIVRDLKMGDFPLSEEAYLTLKEDMLALAITVVDILNGAAYLFDQKPTVNNKHWKSDLELEDFRNSLGLATKSKSNC